MKPYWYAVIAIWLIVTAQCSTAQDHGFGLGVILGEPTGFSAKLWTSPVNAFDFGLGFSIGGDRIGKFNGSYDGGSRTHFHMDYLWHSFDAIYTDINLPVYYGVG